MSEWCDNEVLRALIGTISFIGGWLCFTYCCYKFILCRKEQEKRIQTIIVSSPQQVVTETTCSNCDKQNEYSLV